MTTINPIAELLRVIKVLQTLQSFVLSGDISKILIDPELAAARDAFAKAKIADEPRAQIWSAINHLEAAHQRLNAIHSDDTWLTTPDRLTFKQRMAEKDRFVLCLMATCYRALDELELCRDVLGQAEGVVMPTGKFPHPIVGVLYVPVALAGFLNPQSYVEERRLRNEPKVDVQEVKRYLLQ